MNNGQLTAAQRLYLDLLKACLTRTGFEETGAMVGLAGLDRLGARSLGKLLSSRGLVLVRARTTQADQAEGRGWPASAETMIGMARLNQLEAALIDVVHTGVPGDVIETGVWRGGATIFMRGALQALEDATRRVWVADSFEGLPKPDPGRYPQDQGDEHWTQDLLKVSLEEVQANFARYGLLDEQVRFLPGWFADTLPGAPIEALSILRLDGDMYASTMDALQALYDRVSVGGYVIVDDYGAIPGCQQAITDFRAERGITDPIETIDWTGVFWRRQS